MHIHLRHAYSSLLAARPRVSITTAPSIVSARVLTNNVAAENFLSPDTYLTGLGFIHTNPSLHSRKSKGHSTLFNVHTHTPAASCLSDGLAEMVEETRDSPDT